MKYIALRNLRIAGGKEKKSIVQGNQNLSFKVTTGLGWLYIYTRSDISGGIYKRKWMIHLSMVSMPNTIP